MATPIPTTGPISIGTLQDYYGAGTNSLGSYWDADWQRSDTATSATKMSNLRGTSKEKLRLASVYVDGATYGPGSTITLPSPDRDHVWGTIYAPMYVMYSFAVETVNGASIGPSSVNINDNSGMLGYYSSVSRDNIPHDNGYGRTGVVTHTKYVHPRSVSLPALPDATITVASNTYVSGIAAHYILPNIKSYGSIDFSSPSYTDWDETGLLFYNFIASFDNLASENFDSSAKALLFSAYSPGINTTSSNYDGVTTRLVNNLSTALSITDIGESTGSFVVEFYDNPNGSTCVAGQRILDQVSYQF